MFRKVISLFFSSAILLLLAACGGGGGGSSAGGVSSSSFGARVVVTALESPPIDLFIDDASELRARYAFGSDLSFASIGGGDRSLLATVGRTPSRPLFNRSFNFDNQGQVTLISHRTGSNGGITITPIVSQIPEDRNADVALVRFLHGLSGAPSVTFSAGGTSTAVPFASMSEYLEFSGSELLTTATGTSDGRSFGNILTVLEPGSLYTVVLGGEIGLRGQLWVLNG